MYDYKDNTEVFEKEESILSVKQFVDICKAKWYLFVISVMACLVIAGVYVATRQPVYSRTTTLLLKQVNTTRVTHSELDALLASNSRGSSRLVNEKEAFTSPHLMSEVVSRLGLEISYTFKGLAHDTPAYGLASPIKATFLGKGVDAVCSFTVEPDGDSLKISGLEYFNQAKKKKIKSKSVWRVADGETFSTPAGEISVAKNTYYFTGEKTWKTPVYVKKITNAAATRIYSSKFSAETESTGKINMSDILYITVKDNSVARAEDILNMVVTVYNENWVNDINSMAASSNIFIQARLAALEGELSDVDEAISSFKSRNAIPDIIEVSRGYLAQNAEIMAKLRELETSQRVTNLLYTYLSSNTNVCELLPIPSGIQNNGLVSQINEYNGKVLMYNEMRANSSDMNPIVVDFKDALSSMRSAIMASVKSQIDVIDTQINEITSQSRENTSRVSDAPRQAKELLGYERQQKVKEALYLLLLQKREENELSQAFTAYNTRVLNPPYGLPSPVFPNGKRILAVAFILGLLLPLAFIYLVNVLDTRVRSKKDLACLSMPFLGEIPFDKNATQTPKNAALHQHSAAKTMDLVVSKTSRNSINEAFRVFRTNVEFISKDSDQKVFIVTSYNPGSGKSFITLNAGAVLAVKGKKVLLVDCDFRMATLSKFFGRFKSGFVDYISGNAENDIDKYIVKSTGVDNMSVLPVGIIPPNPSELVGSQKFFNAFEKLREEYDYILVDCAPANVVADTQIMSDIADRTMFVIRAGLFEKTNLMDVQQMSESGKYRNLSIILNCTESSGVYRYGYKYGYVHGEKQS